MFLWFFIFGFYYSYIRLLACILLVLRCVKCDYYCQDYYFPFCNYVHFLQVTYFSFVTSHYCNK
jgi:hypothetical protein